jgi:hypothetical protein
MAIACLVHVLVPPNICYLNTVFQAITALWELFCPLNARVGHTAARRWTPTGTLRLVLYLQTGPGLEVANRTAYECLLSSTLILTSLFRPELISESCFRLLIMCVLQHHRSQCLTSQAGYFVDKENSTAPTFCPSGYWCPAGAVEGSAPER